MRSDFWFTCCFEHMSAIFSILRHKGSFINHVDMVSGREFCQMSICQHKPASLSKMVHKGRGWSIKLPHGFIIIGELVMLNKAFFTFGILHRDACFLSSPKFYLGELLQTEIQTFSSDFFCKTLFF